MVKMKDLDAEMLKRIKNYIKRVLDIAGIDVDINIGIKDDTIAFETSEFNTKPVIMEKIRLTGSGELQPIEYLKNGYTLDICSDFHYSHFGGGRNGTPFGVFRFRVFDKDKTMGITLHFIGFKPYGVSED